MAQIILDSNNNLIQGDFDNATINNRTKFKTTTTNATTNVYAVPNGSATSSGFTATNAADPTNASKITMATNGSTDVQIISGVNGSGTYLPMSFYTNNTLAMQITTAGNIVVAATAAPAFSAYLSSTQSVSSSTTTKVAFNAETFDTNSNYNTSTYRFTPTVAGYYQVNAWIYGSGAGFLESYLYKNGSLSNRLSFSYTASVQANGGSCLIYLNGSTDYIEIYTFNTTATTLDAGSTYSYFQASMVRSA